MVANVCHPYDNTCHTTAGRPPLQWLPVPNAVHHNDDMFLTCCQCNVGPVAMAAQVDSSFLCVHCLNAVHLCSLLCSLCSDFAQHYAVLQTAVLLMLFVAKHQCCSERQTDAGWHCYAKDLSRSLADCHFFCTPFLLYTWSLQKNPSNSFRSTRRKCFANYIPPDPQPYLTNDVSPLRLSHNVNLGQQAAGHVSSPVVACSADAYDMTSSTPKD